MAFALAAGCSAAPPTGETGQPLISANVHVVDANTAIDIAPDQIVVHAPFADDLLGVSAGDLLVSAAGQGFLRGVLSVDNQGDKLVFATRAASLEEAIIEGSAHTTTTFSMVVPRGPHPDTTFTLSPLSYNFGPLSLNPNLQLDVNGDLEFHPSVDVDLEIHHGRVTKFVAVVHADLDATTALSLTASAPVSASYSATLASTPPLTLVQWIGWVPIVETANLSLIATASASLDATATINLGSASAHAGLAAGAQYDGSNWQPVFQPSASFSTTPPSAPSVNATATASLGLDLRAQVLFYGVVGPFVDVGPYVSETLSANPLSAAGRVGLQGSFGGEISVLGHTVASYSTQLFDVGQSF